MKIYVGAAHNHRTLPVPFSSIVIIRLQGIRIATFLDERMMRLSPIRCSGSGQPIAGNLRENDRMSASSISSFLLLIPTIIASTHLWLRLVVPYREPEESSSWIGSARDGSLDHFVFERRDAAGACFRLPSEW